MEKSEPSLVPQWLKGSRNTGSSGGSKFQLASSLPSENRGTLSRAKNKPSADSDHDLGRSSVSDRNSSAYLRRSSSSNGSSHSSCYSNFNKGRHDRELGKDASGYHYQERYLDDADSFPTALPSFDKDPLRRSQSLILGKRVETGPKIERIDLNAAKKYNHSSGKDLNGIGISANKFKFESNFPTLASEERQAGADIGRVPSPGLSPAIQKLLASDPSMTGGDSWKSALAEVPVNVGSSSTSLASAQSISATQVSTLPTKTSGLNMAETVAQGPTRAQTPPLLSVGSQMLEELAIKQSRQLIPLTPSMSKSSVLSPSEKSRPKTGQHHSSLSLNHSRSGPVKSDGLKTSNESRLQILKPSREMNGLASAAKNSISPTYRSNTVNSPVSHSPSSTSSVPSRNSSHSSITGNRKSNLTSSQVTIEKRTMSQAKSRHDFFNLLKKNASQNSPSAVCNPVSAVSDPCHAVSDSGPSVFNPSSAVSDLGPAVPGPSSAVSDSDLAVSSSSSERSDEFPCKNDTTSISLHNGTAPSSQTYVAGSPIQNGSTDMTFNSGFSVDSHQCSCNGEKHATFHVNLGAEEEETAFLRELGWDENADDDGGLTEEEIREYHERKKISETCPSGATKFTIELTRK